MIQKFKCPNCKKESEIDTEEQGNMVTIFCGCGYYMDKIEEREI